MPSLVKICILMHDCGYYIPQRSGFLSQMLKFSEYLTVGILFDQTHFGNSKYDQKYKQISALVHQNKPNHHLSRIMHYVLQMECVTIICIKITFIFIIILLFVCSFGYQDQQLQSLYVLLLVICRDLSNIYKHISINCLALLQVTPRTEKSTTKINSWYDESNQEMLPSMALIKFSNQTLADFDSALA